MKLLPILLTLLTLGSPLLADVVVYTGTGKVTTANSDLTVTFPAKLTLITDKATLQTRVVFAITAKVGPFTKKYVNTTTLAAPGRTEVKKKGVMSSNFSYGQSVAPANGNFLFSLARLSGTNGADLVITSGGATADLPKSLTGSVTALNQSTIGTSTIVVKFSSATTLADNTAGMTIDAATTAAVDKYRSQAGGGYDDEAP